MRRLALIAILPMTACTMQQEYGKDLRIEPVPLISDQHWETTQQIKLGKHERVCTVSSGEMDVSQRREGKNIASQVATSNWRGPGYSYKVLVGKNVYETLDGRFAPAESEAIIRDLMVNNLAYTEIRSLGGEAVTGQWRVLSNKIKLGNFNSQYQACAKFVAPHSSKAASKRAKDKPARH